MMSEIGILKTKNSITAACVRILSVVLCLIMTVAVVTPAVSATSKPAADTPESANANGYYALQVSTGIVAGDSILYFGVRYVDSKGTQRTQMVFPHTDSLKKSAILAAKFGTPDDTLADVKRLVNYEPSVNYKDDRDGLRSYSTDTYVFKLNYGLEKILGVDMFMHHGETNKTVKNEWTCGDIKVYKLKNIDGIVMTGTYSANYEIAFSGLLLAQFDAKQWNSKDFSVNEADKLFRIGRDANAKYGLKIYTEKDNKTYDYNDSVKELLFRFDFADVMGAGIEALVNEYSDKKAKLSDMGLCETAMLSLTYQDIYGASRTAKLPIITSCLYWMMKENEALATQAFSGIAQQGETIMFAGSFPDYAKLTGYSIYFGNDAAQKANVKIATPSTRINNRLDKIGSTKDSVSLTGLSIFDKKTAQAEIEPEDAIIRCNTKGTPLYYYRADSMDGITLSYGTERNLFSGFLSIPEGDTRAVTLLPKASGETYIFELVTDEVELADTKANLSVEITYVLKDGTSKTTKSTNISSLVGDFYGYWPGSNSADFAYYSGTSKNGKLVFSYNLKNVEYFKSVRLTMATDTKDEWQMQSMSIYKLSTLAPRKCSWLKSDFTVNGSKTDRIFMRTYESTDRIQYYDDKLLLTYNNPSYLITFDGSGGSSTERTVVDWETLKESMSFNEAKQDLGFVDASYNYKINVQVYSNSRSDDVYGDCGSNNLFYFQLIFNTGTTAYVLANQQLTSDGFRAGEKESFSIFTNRDYGDLVAVRIIPDDTQSDGSVFDKLNVEFVEVIQTGTGGTSCTWRFDDVGWIGIDYRDNGAEQSMKGRKLRSEMEMSRNYQRTGKGYSLNLLFAIATGQYSEGAPKYQGTLTATINYENSDGYTVSEEVDVARAIAEYSGKVAAFDSTTSQGKEKVAVDEYMLRENRVDRFVVTLFDVTRIYSMTLHTCSSVNTVWPITGVDIYQIEEDGPIILNYRGEYRHNGKFVHLCSNNDPKGYEFQVTYSGTNGVGVAQDHPIVFEENLIKFDQGSWETSIERVPTSNNDSLNMYLHFDGSLPETQTGGYKCAIKYQKRDVDSPYQISIKDLTISGDRTMAYSVGIGASGITALYELDVSSTNPTNISYAIIQHVRDGVVIKTYYISFGLSTNPTFGIVGTPAPRPDNSDEEQVVSLQFGQATQFKQLIANGADIVVGFSYTTVDDPYQTVYDSANVYFTDQQVEQIKAGQVVDIVFHEMFIDKITKVSLTATEQMTATVDSAVVMTYKTDSSGERSCTGHYSVAKPMSITRTKHSEACSIESVTPLEINFQTDSETSYLGLDNISVSMIIGVVDKIGDPREITIPDMKQYIASGSLNAGDIAKVKMLLSDVAAVKYIKITPHNPPNGKVPGWPIASVSASWWVNGVQSVMSELVKKMVEPDSDCILNFSEVVIGMEAKIVKGDIITMTRSTEDKDIDFTIDSDEYITLKPTAIDSISGFGCDVSVASLDNPSVAYEFELGSDGTYIFKPGVHYGVDAHFCITVTSEEKPLEKAYHVNITVRPTPEPPPTTEPETFPPEETTIPVPTTEEMTDTIEITTEPGTIEESTTSPGEITA